MKYEELDTVAKEKAKMGWQDHAADTGWWEHVYSDAVTCARRLGIEIGEQTNRTIKGVSFQSPDISFSGFWSQGDGCSFSGQLLVAELFDATTDVKEYAPQDETLAALAVRAEALYSQFAALIMADRLSPEEEQLYPEFALNMRITIEGKDHHGYSTKIVYNDGILEELEKACNSFVDDFASWIYDQLEAEHEHITSDESFAEWVESNEPDFDEEGELE